MNKPMPIEKVLVELVANGRHARAELDRFENGWVVTVHVHGMRPLVDSDNLFPSKEAAEEGALALFRGHENGNG